MHRSPAVGFLYWRLQLQGSIGKFGVLLLIRQDHHWPPADQSCHNQRVPTVARIQVWVYDSRAVHGYMAVHRLYMSARIVKLTPCSLGWDVVIVQLWSVQCYWTNPQGGFRSSLSVNKAGYCGLSLDILVSLSLVTILAPLSNPQHAQKYISVKWISK